MGMPFLRLLTPSITPVVRKPIKQHDSRSMANTNPRNWTTANQPMTQKQAACIARLAFYQHINMNIAHLRHRISKADASELITMINAGRVPSQQHLLALGQQQIIHPQDPFTLGHANNLATHGQRTYLTELLTERGMVVHIRDDLTVAEASVVIAALRKFF
ncbi:hypothetical protein SCP_0507030 [Sparassis crispa]|uniref:Uncharacterized protein n=1 Tax=Sparassis crispa TaxID=139825 RepID=A0A401GN54_9APHY|nr:hypothetical protein SCP_0507030 [Sparassis crispa]GBE83648.1 hypothetical protein SCP_0507030 [Sparassis crispa]